MLKGYGEVATGEHYSVLRHSRPFVLYRSTKTSVPISIFGSKPLPKKRRVFLQSGDSERVSCVSLQDLRAASLITLQWLDDRRPSWRLKVSRDRSNRERYSALPSNLKSIFEVDIEKLWKPYNIAHQHRLETMQVHIPVASGDGYFRLCVTPHNKPNAPIYTIRSNSPY
jgi:hypothetical protein